MKVILKEDVKGLGNGGDVIEVADGHARNFLVPRGLAVRATTESIKRIEHQKRIILSRLRKQRIEAQSVASRISGLSLTIRRKVGESDKLFGSVTSADIAEAAAAEGVELDRRTIHLEQPLKSVGIYEVPVRLQQDITATLKVWVVAE